MDDEARWTALERIFTPRSHSSPAQRAEYLRTAAAMRGPAARVQSLLVQDEHLHRRTQNFGQPPRGRPSARTGLSPNSAPAAWARFTLRSTAVSAATSR